MRHYILALVVATGCAKGTTAKPDGAGSNSNTDSGGGVGDGPCEFSCDQDGDGVVDEMDQCAGTLSGAVVNHLGCSDAQVTPTLQPTFPAFGLTWTPTGNLGRAGGLTWTYVGIQRMDLFHIDWVVCDDPMPCGISLDGPLDVPAETWQYNALDSDLPNGKLVMTNATHILLADATMPPLTGRVTLNIVDENNAPLPFVTTTALDITPRMGKIGADITGTGFKVTAIADVQDTVSPTWTPYQDYYDAAPTPNPGGGSVVSFGGSFYSE